MKVMVVFGTRPEAIKMCPLIRALKRTKEIATVDCATGQHKEMLEQVLDMFSVVPEYDLAIMQQNQTLFGITELLLVRMKQVLELEKPDLLLVHGDTTTAYVSALAGFYLRIPIGHVEAGLRTYNVNSPFPEEFNRQSIDSMSQLMFAPTDDARENLIREKKYAGNIFVTGNTVIDALKTTVNNSYRHEYLDWAEGSKLILVTAHRRENIGKSMEDMFLAIKKIVREKKDTKVIYPVHMNPAVQAIANKCLAGNDRIKLVEPLDVLDFHNFMAQSYIILTDSGGIQEEAPALGKPVLVMRNTTERLEGVRAGTLKLVGTSKEMIYLECMKLLDDETEYKKMAHARSPYGDGHASEKIVKIILEKKIKDNNREKNIGDSI